MAAAHRVRRAAAEMARGGLQLGRPLENDDRDAARDHLVAVMVGVTYGIQRWGVSKPHPAFFERIVEALNLPPREIAYVGDRVGNDVRPALGAGMVAVHIRRGPWGYLQSGAADAHVRVSSLEELPDKL